MSSTDVRDLKTALDAANARADVAERAQRDATRAYVAVVQRAEEAEKGREYWLQMEQRQAEKTKRAESEAASLRAQVERLRGTKTRVREAQLMHSLAEARALLEGLEDLLEQTMTNTPHPPSYSDCKEGSANIRAWLRKLSKDTADWLTAKPEVKS